MNEIRIPRLKLQVRIIVGFCLLAIIGISVWHAVAERQSIIATAERQAEGYARALAEHSESAFAESDRVLRDVLYDIERAGGIEKINRQELFRCLQRQAGDSPQIGSLFIVDSQGKMFINSLEYPSKQIPVNDRDYFKYYANTPGAALSLSRPVMSRLVNRWRFNLMRPLNRPQDPFSGLIAVAFEVDYFENFFSPASMGPRGRVILLRTDGVPLVFEPYVNDVYQADFSNSVLIREKLPAAPFGTYHDNHSIVDNSPRIISYRRLGRFPVVAVVSLHRDDVLAPWRQKATLHAATIAGLCLVVFLLMQLLMRHLDRLLMAQISLRQQKEQLRVKAAQIDAANDAILLLDVEGALVQINDAFYRMCGYEAGQLQGKRLHDIEPPEYLESIDLFLQLLVQDGELTYEAAFLAKDGSKLPVEINAQLMEADHKTLILCIARDISDRKRSERREQAKSQILEELATGVALPELLLHIVKYVEQERTGTLCSVLVLDESGTQLTLGAAPSLPDFYNLAVNGLKIAEGMGSCGTAAFRRKRVVVEDIEGHPYWKGFNPAIEAGLRSCWSEPIISSEGDLLGTFAIYHKEPRSPDKLEIKLIESAARLASIAIDRFLVDEQKKHLEAQLNHVQRIEAVGQLAGGIAHDFNNLLTPIIVYADMIKRKLPTGDPLSSKTDGIISAAHKARDLTQQLLSFGRKQLLDMKAVDLNDTISTFQEIIRRTIRENITINVRLTPGRAAIWADRGQIEQILLNMAVNAQDAIAGNGTITIETGHVLLDNEYARLHPGLQPGPYVLLGFRDDGRGMNDETLAHIFEPFFTTKQVGHGTGLGLATVYGIVKQHESYITVISREGHGTAFDIYFPYKHEASFRVGEAVKAGITGNVSTAGKTILVVEDNDMVRTMMVELLESAECRVLAADRPSKAMQIVSERGDDIDLMVTDVIMPEMNGNELYENLIKSLPGLKVLYISGYTNELFVHNGTMEEGINFLQKPFTAERLLERVQQTLE
jgi:hypothetical protein